VTWTEPIHRQNNDLLFAGNVVTVFLNATCEKKMLSKKNSKFKAISIARDER